MYNIASTVKKGLTRKSKITVNPTELTLRVGLETIKKLNSNSDNTYHWLIPKKEKSN